MCCMRGGEGTEEERASLPGCAVGCVARVRGLIYIDTAVEVLLMIDDDVLRRGQYELEIYYTPWSACDCNCAATMRRPCARPSIVRAGGVVAARAHVMAILVLTDWSRDIRARTLRSTRTAGA